MRVKLNPVKKILQGKRLVIIEDSIVRGTTMQARVRTLREAGAKEIHLRVSCPPIKHPCYYGIDFPFRRELIAGVKTVEEIKEFLALDSLEYLSLDGMLSSLPSQPENYCTACFTGRYSIQPPHQEVSKYRLER